MQETAIDEMMIERLVYAFYGAARRDKLIGPIFEAKVSDWDRHLTRMCAFWSSVALMRGRYSGTPMQVHTPLPIDAAHFDRWLDLWGHAAHGVPARRGGALHPAGGANRREPRPRCRGPWRRPARAVCRATSNPRKLIMATIHDPTKFATMPVGRVAAMAPVAAAIVLRHGVLGSWTAPDGIDCARMSRC